MNSKTYRFENHILKRASGQPVSVAVIGLGYVGLPLAIEASEKYEVVGFDINKTRIDELKTGYDRNNEVKFAKENPNDNFLPTNNIEELNACDIFVVTVPTPIDDENKPDLGPLKDACELLKPLASEKRLFIFESTVYPGATRDFCIKILSELGAIPNEDYFIGYSPERINPGDATNTFKTLNKVVSGSNDEALEITEGFYKSIIQAETFPVSSLEVAEMAKIIENVQRDINIALINEVALICKRLDISHHEVLKAAATKWNFMPFTPGLVGGHCIGVDPYYLIKKVKDIGMEPKVILSGRDINDSMPGIVANDFMEKCINRGGTAYGKNVLILGAAFKANCNDTRNSGTLKFCTELQKKDLKVTIYDPLLSDDQCLQIKFLCENDDQKLAAHSFDAIAVMVPHDEFRALDEIWLSRFSKQDTKIYDFNWILKASANIEVF